MFILVLTAASKATADPKVIVVPDTVAALT
jgi:hypothetical protein